MVECTSRDLVDGAGNCAGSFECCLLVSQVSSRSGPRPLALGAQPGLFSRVWEAGVGMVPMLSLGSMGERKRKIQRLQH